MDTYHVDSSALSGFADIPIYKIARVLMIYLFKKMPIVAEQLQLGRIHGNKQQFQQAYFQHPSNTVDRPCSPHRSCRNCLFYEIKNGSTSCSATTQHSS